MPDGFLGQSNDSVRGAKRSKRAWTLHSCGSRHGLRGRRDLQWVALRVWATSIITILSIFFTQPAFGQDLVIEQPEATEIARRAGWLIRSETPTGVIELVAIVDGMPLYNTTLNADAADTVNTDECYLGGSGGFDLTGTGVTLGMWDAAGVRLTHQEFAGRANQSDGQSVTHWHSTHVAGTMAAAGTVASAKGMSPSASLDSYDWTYDTTEMAAAASNGLRVSNHSYGLVAGWVYGDFGEGIDWYWFGDVTISATEDGDFGLYSGYAYGQDLIACGNPYYLICRSAGNDRDDDIPTPGDQHFYLFLGQWQDSTAVRDPDGDYDSMLPRASAKNVLTVGAIHDLIGGYAGPSSVVMSSFSAWGPCDDGRIKPDVVASGIDMYSTYDGTDTDYGTLSGTSMASPSVAGSMGLLIEHWRTTHPSRDDMRSSTLKGLVLHTADEAGGGDGPDYQHGWGVMNTLRAANVISDDGANPLTISEWDLHDGGVVELLITTDGTSDLRATICWTDPPGPWQSNVVDPLTKILVNDLDLRIERLSPFTTYTPWVLDGANPSVAATNGENITDNVEQVVIYSPGSDSYVLRISHKSTLTDGPQTVSLIITGAATIQVSGITDIPTLSDWGLVGMAVLLLATGVLVCARRTDKSGERG